MREAWALPVLVVCIVLTPRCMQWIFVPMSEPGNHSHVGSVFLCFSCVFLRCVGFACAL